MCKQYLQKKDENSSNGAHNDLNTFRNYTCAIIADYTDEKGNKWHFLPNKELSLKNNADIQAFNNMLTQSLKTVNPRDTSIIRVLYNLLSYPQKDGKQNYLPSLFQDQTMVSAISTFMGLKNDIYSFQLKAISHLEARMVVGKLNYNKIDIESYSENNIINRTDSLDIEIKVIAYDSSRVMNVEYWIDNPKKTGPPIIYNGTTLKLSSDKPGKHTVYGNLFVIEKGMEKRKPWVQVFYVIP